MERKEFILNVLLCTVIGSSCIVFTLTSIQKITGGNHSISNGVSFLMICFLTLLYILSKKGYFKISSFCFLSTLFGLATYLISEWSGDLPSVLVSYILIIVLSGILINTRFACMATIVTSGSIICMSYFQVHEVIELNTYWKKGHLASEDVLVFIMLFLFIAIVSLLSNRETERALVRARLSESELKKERDSLEIKVIEKTRELKEVQANRISQLYRFAEFGRISSGLFHDLINPLSAISLNVEKLNENELYKKTETRTCIEYAMTAVKKMEEMLQVVRKQLSQEENRSTFSINSEILQVVEILKYKSEQTNVHIKFFQKTNGEVFGDAIKFHHAVLNLVSNAIDSYETLKNIGVPKSNIVQIIFERKNSDYILSIQDFGMGIEKENIEKIFEPFFTTKITTKGIGIGLSITKRIIEKDFCGTLEVESAKGKGTKFVITIPVINPQPL